MEICNTMQTQPEINLCSTTSSSISEDEITIFSPIKPQTESPPSKPNCDIIKQLIPNVMDDYHDMEKICSGDSSADSRSYRQAIIYVNDSIRSNLPSKTYISNILVVDLRCIDDLRADDNGVWTHGGKPSKKYCIEREPDTGVVISAEPLEGEPTLDSEIFTLVRLYHHHKATLEFQRRISLYPWCMWSNDSVCCCTVYFWGWSWSSYHNTNHHMAINAKKDLTYRCTQKSTLSRIKEMEGKPGSASQWSWWQCWLFQC